MRKRLDEAGLLLFPTEEELRSELIRPKQPTSDLELALRYMAESKQTK